MPARPLSLLMFLSISTAMFAPCAIGQDKTIATTVCKVAKNPAAFDNKFVRLRATVARAFGVGEVWEIRDPVDEDCPFLRFTYPSSDPSQPRPAVHLKNDDKFREFQRHLHARMFRRERNSLDWPRYEVTAVMVGLVEFLGSGPEPGESRTAPASSRWRIVLRAPVQFVLQSIKHISVEDLYDATSYSTKPIRFPTGYVAGTLIGADGQPILGADVKIYATSELSYPLANATSYTNAKGQFQFAVAPGDYVIGFNIFEPPSAEAPYPPTYYPSTRQRAKATVVSVADNQHVSDLVFKLPPPLAPRIIPVEVLWPDGKPVGEAMVLLSQEIEPHYVEGKLVGHTAVDGTLDVSGFEGIDYVLHADKYAGPLELGLLPQGDPIACSKNLSIPAAEPIPSRIQFFLTITDRDVCKNFWEPQPANGLRSF